jgi:hypothetical protein
MIAIFLALLSLALQIGYFSVSGFTPRIVVIDTAKITNSARSVASSMINGDMAATIDVSGLGNKLADAITLHADGALVIDKQSVVRGNLKDITDDVLISLALPTDVPTIKPDFSAMSVADTAFSQSPVYKIRDDQITVRNKILHTEKQKETINALVP